MILSLCLKVFCLNATIKGKLANLLCITFRTTRTQLKSGVVASAPKKVDIKKQGMESVKNEVVKANLQGISRKMANKDWVDAQGRKGKVSASVICWLGGAVWFSS